MVGLITFEGGDGTGKTTQIKLLEEYLKSKGRACIITREPGGTSLGESIRQMLLDVGDSPISTPAELFLYLADRTQHVYEIIAPALEHGQIVLCDRYVDSTLAYQGYGRGLDLKLLRDLNAIATLGLQPGLTFLLDCPIEMGLRRTVERQARTGEKAVTEDRFEREHAEFHEKIRLGFLEMARLELERFRVIDATQSVEQITLEVRKIIDRELAL